MTGLTLAQWVSVAVAVAGAVAAVAKLAHWFVVKVEGSFGGLRSDFHELRSEMHASHADTRNEIHGMRVELVKHSQDAVDHRESISRRLLALEHHAQRSNGHAVVISNNGGES